MPTQDIKGAPSSLSDAINMLMENPEIISSVASALGNISQTKESGSDTASEHIEKEETASADQGRESAAPQTPDLSALVSSLSPLMMRLSGSHPSGRTTAKTEVDRREALLCALKPYVSEGRQEAIDYILRISRISEVLKTIQPQE